MPATKPVPARSRHDSSHRSGHMALALGVGAAAAVAAVGLFLPRNLFMQRVASNAVISSSSAMTSTLVAGDLSSWLCRVGLDPANLAAAGVRPEAVARMASDARAHLVERLDAMAQLQNAQDGARQRLQDLNDTLRTGSASSEDLAALAAARVAAEAADADLAAAKSVFLAAATASLTPEQRAVLASLVRNAGQEVPPAYRAVAREERAWRLLRDDLAHVRIATRLGEEPDAECVQRVAAEAADPTVAAALSHTANQLDALTQSWEVATR